MGFEGATWRGFSFLDIVWPNAAALAGTAVVLFGAAAAKFRWDEGIVATGTAGKGFGIPDFGMEASARETGCLLRSPRPQICNP
jgi:hypothetical protein